ncbi:MAG: hypothetical protein AAF412_02820 [Pseudomonadota bacterium]
MYSKPLEVCGTRSEVNTTNDHPSALSHVRWIGGGSGAAKSTIARRLAKAHDAVIYDTDAVMSGHASRCSEHLCPRLANFMRMTMDQRWVVRSPNEMLETFHWFEGEGFNFIVEDLLALPNNRLVIAEGFRLLPLLVAPLLKDKRRAIWLLPTPAFRRRAFDARETTWDIPQKTSNPKLALANLMSRDELFTDRLHDEVSGLGLHKQKVDGALSEDALIAVIDDHLFG